MSRATIVVVFVASALCAGGIASVVYWIAQPEASDAFLYAAPMAGFATVVICGLAALVSSLLQKRRG